ncbi:MAG: hypothetical protein WA004_15195 [Saprospiraceae bacterium]
MFTIKNPIALSIILVLFIPVAVWSQSNKNNQVRNVRSEIDEEKITFTYDLEPDGQYRYFNVCLCSVNPDIVPRNVVGVGRNLSTGKDKQIYWYYVNDGYTMDQLIGLDFDVIGLNPLEKEPAVISGNTTNKPPVSVFAGLGTFVAGGGGLLVLGLTKENDAQELYTIYKDHLDPADSVYFDQPRDELYNEANSKHKAAQYLMAGGGAVVVTAGAMLVNRILAVKRINKFKKEASNQVNKCFCIKPADIQVIPSYTYSGFGVGVKITF